MNINAIRAWMRQPTSVIGLAVAMGILTALAEHVVTSAATAVPFLAFAAVAILLPDNTHAKTDAMKLALDVAAAVANPSAPSVSAAITDVAALAQDLAKKGASA